MMVGRAGTMSSGKGPPVTVTEELLLVTCTVKCPAVFKLSEFRRTRAPMDVEVDPAAKTTLICVWGSIVVDLLDESTRVTPVCESAPVAARKISCCKPPWGATDGEMPVKAMSLALMMVTAACAMRALSTLENAKTVTMPAALTGVVVEDGAAVGTAAGAL